MAYHSDYYDNDNYDPESLDERNGGYCPIHGDETHATDNPDEEAAGLAWCPSCQGVIGFVSADEAPETSPLSPDTDQYLTKLLSGQAHYSPRSDAFMAASLIAGLALGQGLNAAARSKIQYVLAKLDEARLVLPD